MATQTLTREQKRHAMSIVRMDDWDEPWGTAKAHMFAVCDTLYHADADDLIPYVWHYRHGPGCEGAIPAMNAYAEFVREHPAEAEGTACVEHDRCYPPSVEWPDEEYVPFLDAGELGIDMLLYAGCVLFRYLDRLERAGKSY